MEEEQLTSSLLGQLSVDSTEGIAPTLKQYRRPMSHRVGGSRGEFA